MTVEMECNSGQPGGACGLKRLNATSLIDSAVPEHVESAINELFEAIDRVQAMADSLRAAIAPGQVRANSYYVQFCFLF
jgi:hypothetical protein